MDDKSTLELRGQVTFDSDTSGSHREASEGVLWVSRAQLAKLIATVLESYTGEPDAAEGDYATRVDQSLVEIGNLIGDMRREQEEINALRSETQALLNKLTAA